MDNKMKLPTMWFGFCVLLLAALSAGAQTTDADFQQAVAAYQQSHSQADAEKVINLAREMNPPPAVPEEARRHYVKASTHP